MSYKIKDYVRFKYILAVAVACLIGLSMLLTGSLFDKERISKSDYSGWYLESGEEVYVDGINTGDFGGTVTVYNTIPDPLNTYDSLCFISNNVNFCVYIDDELIYRYDTKPNFTGNGYGIAYHTIGLFPEHAGKTVKLEYTCVYSDGKDGQIRKPAVENAKEYRGRIAKGQLIPFNISVGIMIIGIMLLFLRLVIPYSKTQASLVMLGINAVITGIWLANDTGFLRLVVDAVIIGRIVDHAALHLWMLPLMLFVYSVTAERNRKYQLMAFLLTFADIAVFLILRFAFGVDMGYLTGLLVLYFAAGAALMTVMICSDRKYCKNNNISKDRYFFYMGLILFAVFGIIDLIIYASGVRSVTGRGGFTRVGFCVFFLMMALETIHTWIDERALSRRERIINQMLRYAVSSTDPEVSINAIIEYVGREFGALHTYIYENRSDGTFHKTYEWFAEGAERPEGVDYSDIPYEGLIDKLLDVFLRDHRLIVDGADGARRLSPILYSIVHGLKLERLVAGPLECNGELIGLLGADDPPFEKCTELADVIWLISYFVTQLLLQRNEKRGLLRYSYTDSLTGTRNRRAMVEFEVSEKCAAPFGYVMCDINGLKKTNDTHGHEAGDALIIDVAQSMVDVFGEENVYRIGGDEFVAYAFTDGPEQFNSMVEHLKNLIAAKGRSASIGAIYVADDSLSKQMIREKADELMYKEKEKYYNGVNDRRNRQ